MTRINPTVARSPAGPPSYTPDNITLYMGGAAGSHAPVYATLDPNINESSYEFSNGDLTVTRGIGGVGTWGIAASTFALTSGKWYWETTGGSAVYSLAGVGDIVQRDVGTAGYAGSTSKGWSFFSAGFRNNNGNNFVLPGIAWTPSDVIRHALDLDSNTYYVMKNGDDTPVYTWDISSRGGSPMFVLLSIYQVTNTISVNFGASAFTYSVPSGYNSGFYQ